MAIAIVIEAQHLGIRSASARLSIYQGSADRIALTDAAVVIVTSSA